jgi:hypothetical protein
MFIDDKILNEQHLFETIIPLFQHSYIPIIRILDYHI